jgi:hypothetical protein
MTSQRTVSLRAFLGAILGLSAVFALVVVAIVKIDERDEREDAQAEIDLNYLNCLRGNEVRQVQIDNEREPGQALDLTPLLAGDEPEWFVAFAERLKTFSAAAATRPIDPASRTGRRIARIEAQLRDCEVEWPQHTAALVLPHTTTTTTGPGGDG